MQELSKSIICMVDLSGRLTCCVATLFGPSVRDPFWPLATLFDPRCHPFWPPVPSSLIPSATLFDPQYQPFKTLVQPFLTPITTLFTPPVCAPFWPSVPPFLSPLWLTFFFYSVTTLSDNFSYCWKVIFILELLWSKAECSTIRNVQLCCKHEENSAKQLQMLRSERSKEFHTPQRGERPQKLSAEK